MSGPADRTRSSMPAFMCSNKNPVKYLGQDYETLKAQCLAANTLFEDETFPASSSSLGVNKFGPDSAKAKDVTWLRPSEIKTNPQFIVDGAKCVDVCQGSVGDCWFLASIASLTMNEEFLSLVVPGNQSFQTDYAGIFHFKLWQYGEWLDVVVDDRLPTKNQQLMFVKSGTANEFWSSLLEKAYAKLNGSYESLIGGLPFEALQDFTGGISEIYCLNEAPGDLFQIIQKALKMKSLVTCSSISADEEERTKQNVIKGHAYSLVGAVEVSFNDGKEKLIRVRNPWGYAEWNGAWSDNSSEWDKVDPKVKADLNLQCDDGEAWIPYSSFTNEFCRVEICHVSLEFACSDQHHTWCLTQFDGSWRSGFSADTYCTNPQFRIRLEEPDDDHEVSTEQPCCTVIVGLMQKNRRKIITGEKLLPIGFYIYRYETQDFKITQEFLKKNKQVAYSIYKNTREVSTRFKLPVGEYLIVPSTYDPNQDADFCLRVFSEKNADSSGGW
ncbi:calpain-8-like isoform X2 [Bombina bombina]|uniref:calpain-8-like isoform X2 n=1 Tax=Bombina bombina TaxID=8345 RepID=UPI00235ACCDB|nr:calpain-8-like isoform X2 [Bombina bombina]